MELIAAIDVLDGRGVRLRQGDYSRPLGGVDPLQLAAHCAAEGVPRLHLVDLDGARSGRPRELQLLTEVVRTAREAAPRIRIQAGGGLRTADSVRAVLGAGVDTAVIGTAALEQPGFVAECAARWPGRILAALDLRDGRIAVDGWQRTTAADPLAVFGRFIDEGAAGLIVTDVRRDGTLTGPNLELLASFRGAFPAAWLAAAGGVRSTTDLLDLESAGMDGAIVGMALLTNIVTVSEALAALRAASLDAAAATR